MVCPKTDVRSHVSSRTWNVLHVACDFRQGVPKLATDQPGAWADGAITGGGCMPVLQGRNGHAKNLGDVLSVEEWAKVPFKINTRAPVRRAA